MKTTVKIYGVEMELTEKGTIKGYVGTNTEGTRSYLRPFRYNKSYNCMVVDQDITPNYMRKLIKEEKVKFC